MINLYFELSSVADWIVVSLTALGVLIALIGLIFAIVTVNNWQKEKKWEILSEAISKAKDALYYVSIHSVEMRVKYYPTFSEKSEDEGNSSTNNNLKYLHNKFKNTNTSREDILLINEKLKSVFKSKPNVVSEYYSDIVEHIIVQNLSEAHLVLSSEFMNFVDLTNPILSDQEINKIDYGKRVDELLDKMYSISKEDIELLKKQLIKVLNYFN